MNKVLAQQRHIVQLNKIPPIRSSIQVHTDSDLVE
jgi:hypothetical protein